MKKVHFLPILTAFFVQAVCLTGVLGQNADPMCAPGETGVDYPAAAFFNYGTGTSIRNSSRIMDLTVGQTVVGSAWNNQNATDFGYWGQFLIPPFAPTVKATQGELLDRIQVSWAVNPLGALPSGGFKVYRDGVFLELVDNETRNYNDFNVIAGRPYNYEIRGVNIYGEGSPGKAVGFQVPNGVVTGWVQTSNARPVPDALVALMPMQGFSAAFGPSDGAFARADAGTNGNFLPNVNEPWTLSFWVQTNLATSDAGILSLHPFPMVLRAVESASGQEGIEVAEEIGDPAILTGFFPDSTKNGWHHIALTADENGQGRLFIDAILVAVGPLPNLPLVEDLRLGARTESPGTWTGKIDELRVYHRRLDELDLGEAMMGTASSLTPGLKYYWKMDEELGTGSFDVLRRNKIYFCGTSFDIDRPAVRTMGKTNNQGFYRIESASYGTGTTFLAEPMKNFYLYRALKFVRAQEDYAALPNFSVSPKATIELWVNNTTPEGNQCLLAKKWPGNDFRLLLKQNGLSSDVSLYLNGQEHIFGELGMGYQHLAFTIDSNGTDRSITAYKNGVLFGSAHTYNGVTGNWSDTTTQWILGARSGGGGQADHFEGLIDEVAWYDTTLTTAKIFDHFQNGRDMQEKGLRAYFSLDEGSGNRLNNSGSVLLPFGILYGADWTPFTARQMTTPHVFSPGVRQVTLNPSITSVDQVDFTDLSTVPVSGYVRYRDTDCFAANVEILVNGASYSPPIFTDSTGKFIIDFDPGTTAELSPVFEDHVFVPATWEVINVSSPIAGVLFNDITTRKVQGKVAGGTCEKSIIKAPPGVGQGTVCVVKVRTPDGCLERQITIDNQEGTYEFVGLPPVRELIVAVTEHSDPDVKAVFETQGGSTVNLTQNDTSINFIYFAPPEVVILSGLDTLPGCSPAKYVLEQYEFITLKLGLTEHYVPILNNMGGIVDDGVCPLDTADFRIINGFADITVDSAMSGGELEYMFRVGDPNPSPPYLKTLQIVGTSVAGRTNSLTTQGIVTGIRNKENTFTTMLPQTPSVILRDPPGDGSSAFIETGTKVCTNYGIVIESESGISNNLNIDLGPEIEVASGQFILKITKVELFLDTDIEVEASIKAINNNMLQTCVSYNEKIATSDSDVFIGSEGDIYMGEALNLIFGFADKVTFNDTTCTVDVEQVLNIQPGEFSTTFIYSESHIKNTVLRYLEQLENDPNSSVDDSIQYADSRVRWQDILQANAVQKENAKVVRNLSFDAGTTYEYAVTNETSASVSLETIISGGFSVTQSYGAEIQGVGTTGTLKIFSNSSAGASFGVDASQAITTGYTLADDDIGDAFTVDVAMDSVYGTPVFRLKAGQSSCPWEPGTANREAPNLQLAQGSQFNAVNIPANEPAVFQMNLGNLSATNEDWTYGFTAIAANNPHGAVIKLNGQVLNNNTVQYIVPYGTSVPITLTVERGPLEYSYDSLLVALVSECEMARNFALSIPLDANPNFFSPIYLGVDFIRPCSEVAINVPSQGWVIFPDPLTPGPDDELRITASGYNTNVTDFQLVRVQYRPSEGDGAWINIPGISDRYNPNWSGYNALPDPKPPVLEPGFTQFFWETTGLADGPYDIRAVAVCTGDATNKPGFSQIIKGRIDREPPSLVGTPQPSDGVFHVGDEISFTFNKHINCNKLIQADLFNANNVGLYDATTGLLIDANITCFENKIILDPNFQNQFFENRILRVELHDIEDLTGNKRDFLKWEFYVDRNELAWLTDSLGMTKFEDQTKTAVANIHNRGGYPVPFSILGVPDWVHVVPNQGTLAPNEIRPVSFTADSTLAFGLWTDSITLRTETGQNPFFMGGDEGLPLGVRVVCRPPHWQLNPFLFENSENMVLELNIEGVVSTDVEDMVVAYIGDTLCGKAKVQFVPAANKYLAYLTIYGNPHHVLQPLRLEIWDASACLRYTVAEDYFLFQPDDVVGSPLNPQVLHTNSTVLRDLPLGFGWNWLSFNLDFPDPGINAALALLKHPDNDMLKAQNAFSVYLNGSGWLGSLNTLGNTSMYVYRADQSDTLKMLGTVLDPALTPIPVLNGWNWIGYIPNYSLPVNEALSSLTPQTGDLIKGQLAFAQYTNPTYGWVGNLKFMQPPNGYQIKMSVPGTLTYPPPSSNLHGGGTENTVQARNLNEHPPVSSFWNVDPTQFEHSMTLIGMLKRDDGNATTASMELGAFVGAEVRGSGQAIYIPLLDSYLFFLTVYANSSGEKIDYQLFDGSTGATASLNESMFFAPDLHQGSIETPLPFTLVTSGISEAMAVQSFDVQPNPFHNETVLRFALTKAQDVRVMVTNISGQQVSNWTMGAREGLNTVIWRGQSDNGTRLANGVYFVRLQTESGNVVRKVVLH